MSYDPDYYFEHEPSEADRLFDEIKERIRSQVKQEITEELTALRRTKTREMSEQLGNLRTLEKDAERAKREYEMKKDSAEYEARRQVEKGGLKKLLTVLAEPRYTVSYEYLSGPKCDKCNEDRDLEYTTPRGKAATERCECATSTRHWKVEEVFVHEVQKRNGQLTIWYRGTDAYLTDRESDYFNSGSVLKSADAAELEDILRQPNDYSFTSEEAAQKVTDARNAKDAA